MKKRHDTFRRGKHCPRPPRPEPARRIIPPPLIVQGSCHPFHPDLVDKFVYSDGVGIFLPQTTLSLNELMETAQTKLVLTRRKNTPITGYWWITDGQREPVPEFIFDKIRHAVDHDEAFLLLSDGKETLTRVLLAIVTFIGPPAGSA